MAKFAHDTIVPFKESNLSKKQQVATMFDKIAFRYDFLNRFLSAGIDIWWRKKAIDQLKVLNPQTILDVATGTGDVALMMEKTLKPNKIIGIDISQGMLDVGREKVKRKGLEHKIVLQQGDSENLQFDNSTFDAITVAFGVRNFQNLETGLHEMHRVLKEGGRLIILEFSRPRHPLFKFFYNLYMNRIAPAFGKFFAKNKDAYQYLNDSVQKFPEGNDLIKILAEQGFKNNSFQTLTFGICTIYISDK